MEQKSMTALISAFSRGYHSDNNQVTIFDDFIANKLISNEEKEEISVSMSQGIKFFNPQFVGTKEESLRWIVDNQLSPSPLGRAAYNEAALKTAVENDAKQYLIIGSGYDTFAYRQPNWAKRLKIFEMDHPLMSKDKQNRVGKILKVLPDNLSYIAIDLSKEDLAEKMMACLDYECQDISFCSLLGISYYLSKDDFSNTLKNISKIVAKGSRMVIDYPDHNTYTENAGERTKKQVMMAGAANEAMRASYSYEDFEKLLLEYGFCIHEHLIPSQITKQYFDQYNNANPQHPITAFDNVNYCLAVKK